MFTICSISGRDPDSLLEPKNRATVAKEHRAILFMKPVSQKCQLNEVNILLQILSFFHLKLWEN